MTDPLRVAVDASPWRRVGGGMSRYVEQWVAHAPAEAVRLTLLTNRPQALPSVPEHAGVLGTYPIRPTLLWRLVIAPRLIDISDAHAAHFTTGRGPLRCRVPLVLTVHDLTPIEWPELYRWRERLLVAPWLNRSIRNAAAIIAVSRDTAEAITRRYPSAAARVRVIHEAAAPIFHRPIDAARIRDVRVRYGLGPRAWLHIGGLTARKNVARLVEAFARVLAEVDWSAVGARADDLGRLGQVRDADSGVAADHGVVADPRPRLVLVGAGGGAARGAESRAIDGQIRALGVGDRVRCLDYVPEADLPALYAAAELIIAPSLHEGFGLAVVEAMAVGTPVVTSHRGGLAEVAGGAAWIVDPESVGSIAAGLARLASDAGARSALGARGRLQAARFDWARSAAETAAVLREVVATQETTAQSPALW